MEKDSLIKALKFTVPFGVIAGVIFGLVAGFIAPEMKTATTLFSIASWIILLTPVMYLTVEKQEKLGRALEKQVSEKHSVLRKEQVNLFVNRKLRATGVLFLTEDSLLFFATEKKNIPSEFQCPFSMIISVSKGSKEQSTLNAITIQVKGNDDEISFTTKDRDYWMNQIAAKITH